MDHRTKSEFPIVYIHWDDHSSFTDQSWRDYKSMKTLSHGFDIKTVGYLVKEDKKSYYLVMNASRESFSGCMRILKGCIKKMKYLDAEG